ncbi:ribbon-helix-helix domain-containing protein [Gloeothece verrucosa]|uniref:CopG-like ribbon-helix-helix domain-containing protein n=1 Tax=Gloeothece verrucosa (strain PCC 7822) TaxID=497965 RepID=E0UNJ6_GLOV7|nr:hypothetical protein [Gloeothece verrucosa]ADN18526.1 hypothetical protein Cyan7822_6881 [Gloeothece verrucosa PCC 7822]
MTNVTSKRLNLSLPEHLYDDLRIWADHQGRSMANLANFLLERSISTAKVDGEFPTNAGEAQAVEFLKAITKGERPKNSKLVKLAHCLDLETDQLVQLCDRLFMKK